MGISWIKPLTKEEKMPKSAGLRSAWRRSPRARQSRTLRSTKRTRFCGGRLQRCVSSRSHCWHKLLNGCSWYRTQDQVKEDLQLKQALWGAELKKWRTLSVDTKTVTLTQHFPRWLCPALFDIALTDVQRHVTPAPLSRPFTKQDFSRTLRELGLTLSAVRKHRLS